MSSQEFDSSSSSEDEVERAVQEIMEDEERLERECLSPPPKRKRKGKERAPKRNEGENNMWDELKRLQQELSVLKNPKSKDIDVNVGQSTSGRKVKQLSSATITGPQVGQTQAAQIQQNDDAAQIQQNDAAQVQQNQTGENQDEITISANDTANDPLQWELENQSEEDSDEDQEVVIDDKMFETLVEAVDINGEEEVPGAPITQSWADKINLAWKTKVGKTNHSTLLKKYRTPSNLDGLKIPSMNNAIWKLCNKWQKKADLNMAASQRTLIKVVSAVLGIQTVCTTSSVASQQVLMQTTADIVTLLGKVNREISLRRKISARSVLVGDYKSLATTTKETEENLFGDNPTQDIKDVNIRRKIERSG